MLYQLPSGIRVLFIFQGFLISYFFFSFPKTLVNAAETEINKKSNLSVLNSQEDTNLNPQNFSKLWEIKDNQLINIKETELNSYCSTFIPLTNTIKPTSSFNENQESNNQTQPNSACAIDLLEITNPTKSINQITESSLNREQILSEDLPTFGSNEITNSNNDDRWHFKLQPYATIPINTYGTVSARGKTVSYHLTLGELLDTLRVAASGRFEGWKGRWGGCGQMSLVHIKRRSQAGHWPINYH